LPTGRAVMVARELLLSFRMFTRHPRRFASHHYIAVAEDDADTREMIAERLRMGGYEVVEAESGGQLLDALAVSLTQGESELPDLVVADLAMPDYTGLEVLAWLKTLDHTPPCILITGYASDEVRQMAGDLGAAAVLSKPLDLDVVARLVGDLTGVFH
jgi:CheY-like chemotaxis protein